MINFIDSHAHLGDDKLFSGFSSVVFRAKKAGVFPIINVCTDALSLLRGREIKKKYPEICLAAAIPPHDADSENTFWPELRKAAENRELAAIGETGLDYCYHQKSREKQKVLFQKHLALAREYALPLIFHVREAFGDFFSLLPPPPPQGVFHCFTGNLQEAQKALELGFYLSFSGILTFPKSTALQQVAQKTPLDKILLETDAPYLAPQSQRGQANEPAFLIETAQKLAFLKELSLEEVAKTTASNTKKLFGLPF
ncbi:MAG: TatD family hydrolase [Parachlamydiales bacterium]|jgi:TatD DNase family protein